MKAIDSDGIKVYYQDGTTFVCINRPEKFNALNSTILERLLDIFEQLDRDGKTRVVVLKGLGGKAFIAGADIKEISTRFAPFDFRDYYIKFVKLSSRLMNLSKPVIAAVQGYAFGGGCLMALSSDFVIATDKSKFGQQEINYGFMGSAGLLPKLIGKHKAAELVMLGDAITAQEAYRLGIVNKLVSDEDLDSTVNEYCSRLLSKSPRALEMIKSSIRIALEAGLSTSNLYESEVASLCISTTDAQDSIKSFVEKS